MQVVLLVPEADWLALVAEVEQLKQTVAQLAPAAKLPDRLLNVREAAHYLRLKPEGVRNARRRGRLTGVRLNEKEWGFRSAIGAGPLPHPLQPTPFNRLGVEKWPPS